jgi:hypothetical protein
MKPLFLIAASVFVAAVLTSTTGCQSPAGAGKPLPLKVAGAQILDSKNQPVHLHGVNAASMEFTSDGEGHILKTVNVAIHDWHVNIIRLPLSQDRWFGKGARTKRRRQGLSRFGQTNREGVCHPALLHHS